MLSSIIPSIVNKRIVLASSSPRRRNLLPKLGLQFTVQSSDFPEDLDKSLYIGKPGQYCIDNARFKALDVAQKLLESKPDLIIGVDTVVSFKGKIIEKPSDEANALQILTSLNGNKHEVYSGVCLLVRGENTCDLEEHTFDVKSTVKFADLDDKFYKAYIETGEPMDKAGGYGIQGYGALLVEGIEGDFYNVEGLPIFTLSQRILQIYSHSDTK